MHGQKNIKFVVLVVVVESKTETYILLPNFTLSGNFLSVLGNNLTSWVMLLQAEFSAYYISPHYKR